MPEPTFRGDPYRILDVRRDATAEEIKRRWRDLAREHHPDRAAGAGRASGELAEDPEGDQSTQQQLTTRMARINAAYDVLRDPVKRARYDASPHAWRAREADREAGRGPGWDGRRFDSPPGPPPPPPTRPVTARYDTSSTFRRRNSTIYASGSQLKGQPPRSRHQVDTDLRASTPTGPVRRERGRSATIPTLEQARSTLLEFGRFHGWTLGEVADREPTYVDWIARTITRDRDLVACARVVAADLDERGVERVVRQPRPGFGTPGGVREAAEASAG
jgi:curved DNA-binding protein CbpA